MDFLTIFLFVSLLLVLFGGFLILVTRETSYEQALEEQRNKSEFDLLTSSSSTLANSNASTGAKQDKLKSKKSKEHSNKKSKESKEKVQTSSVAKAAPANASNSSAASATGAKAKETVAVVVPQPAAVLTVQSEQLSKSIPTTPAPNAGEKNKEKETMVPKQPAANATKSSEEPKIAPKKVNNESMVTPITSDSLSGDLVDQIKSKSIQNLLKSQISESSKLKENKKSKKSISSKVSRDLTMNDIIEAADYLSPEEVNQLMDMLLNKQAGQPSSDLNWHKKNDPVESLKKQLAEKEDIIFMHKNNLESAKHRLDNLQQEITFYKKSLAQEQRIKRELEHERDHYQVRISELEQKQKHQLDKIEEHRSLRNEENARLNNIIQDLKNKNAALQLKINEKEKWIEQLEEKAQLNEVNQQSIERLQEDFEKEKNILKLELQNQHREELEDLTSECRSLRKTIEELMAEKDKLAQKLKSVEAQTQEVQANSKKRLEILDVLCTKLGAENYEKLIEIVDDIKSKYEKNDEVHSQLNESYEKILKENTSIKQELEEKVKKCDDYEITLANTDRELNQLQQKASKVEATYKSELSNKNEKINEIEEELSQLNEQLSSLTKEKIELNEKLKEMNNVLQENEKIIKEKEYENKFSKEEIEELREENEKLTKKITGLQEIVDAGCDSFENEKRKVKDLETKLAQLNGNENNTNTNNNNNNNANTNNSNQNESPVVGSTNGN